MISSSDPLDAIAVALQVAAAIEAAGGAYFVGGSLASSLQGEPRATNDIDIVLELPLGQIGIHHPKLRARAIKTGNYPASPGCTPPYAPIWITEMVRRREGARG